MITKEFYRTREDGVKLYKTYSDTEHKIRNIKTNAIYGDAIDIDEDTEYEEVEDYIELEGPETLEEITPMIESIKQTTKKINRINLTDNESLSVKELYPSWDSKIGKNVEVGYKLLYNDNLWRVRQNHMVLEVYPPSLATAALYEVINYQHEGTIDDPIPYVPPMEIFKDKYYIQNNVIYKCTRDSGTALSHDLSALVGMYVEIIENN
jgi:hypothetical protein